MAELLTQNLSVKAGPTTLVSDASLRLVPGELVALLPEHVCTTVNLYRDAQLVRGLRDLGSSAIVAASRSSTGRDLRLSGRVFRHWVMTNM